MADYRPMPRGAYDANGRPIGRWPEPPEPVAPRQDLLPTPAPAPAPVQRTSPGGVGWMPNKQERDMMQDLYPESTQRPPTRLEKFFQWLSGSSDAGAAVNYDPNARGFALSDATIPTAAVTNTSTATPPVYVDFLRPDMQGLVQQEASRMTAQPELRRAYGEAADYVRGTAAPAAVRAYNGAVDFVTSPILPADINTLGRQEFGRMTAQPELRRAYNGVVDYTSDNIVPAIEGYREPASDFVSRQVFEPVIGGVPSRAPGAPDIPPFRWGVEGRNTAGGLFRAPELDGLYGRAVDYTSGTSIPAARDAYDRAVDYTSGTIIPAARNAYDRTASFASSVQTPARAPGAPAVPAFNWTEEGARAAGDVFRAPELDGLYGRAVDYTSGTIIPAARDAYDRTADFADRMKLPARTSGDLPNGPRGSLPVDRAALYERSMNQVGGQPEASVRVANRPYEGAAVTRDAAAQGAAAIGRVLAHPVDARDYMMGYARRDNVFNNGGPYPDHHYVPTGVSAAPYSNAAPSGGPSVGADTLYPSNGSNFLSGSRVAPIYGDAKPGGPSQSATAGAYLSAEIGGRPTPVSDAMYRHLGIVPPSPQNTYESYPDHFYVPGGRIGAPSVTAPPPAPVTTSPEIAIPYAGGTYYRNDSSGVPVLSNVPGGTYGIGFNSAPAYAMGTTLAAQRPDIYNPDGTPRQTTFGGQAIDPTLGPALEQMQALTKELQASNPRGGAPVIVGGESPFDVAARRIRNSNLSIGTQMRYLADLDKQRAEAERSAANNATQLRVADIGAQSAAARLQDEDRRSQERNSIDNRRLDILDRNSQGREVVEPIVPKLTSVESTTAPNTRIHTAQIGSFAGTGATAQEAIDSANANIVASAAATFEKAISNPTQRAQLEQDLGTTDPGELRKKYMEIVVRRLSTQRRRTQNIGGDYPAE